MGKSSQRISYFDFIRGIAIVMVVAIHTTTSCNLDSISGTISTIARQCLNCAVPLFLASSAFFLSKTNTSTFGKYLSFLKKQIPKIYIPVLIWSIYYFTAEILSGDNIFVSLVYFFCCGYSIYYFIALIIQCYILLPILQKYPKLSLALSILITFVSLILHTKFSINNPLPLIIYAGPFTLWILYFVLGLYLANTRRSYSLIVPIFLILLGIITQYVELSYLNSNYHDLRLDIKTSTMLYSSGVILLLFSNKIETTYNNFSDNKILKLFEFFGKKSFIIYLCHCYIISFVSSIYYTSFWSFNFATCFILTILFVLFLQKITPKSIHKYIGLK